MKSAATPEAQMRALKTWAVERMTKGTDTPFAWFQFMKLLEVIDTFLEAGDEALIPNPGYPTYRSAVTLTGATCVDYDLKEDNGWLPNFDELEKIIAGL